MIVVHHLNNSRSQRVLWLLEELGLPYEIQYYERSKKTMLAPPALRRVHPLGKSPVITDNGTVVAESGAILEYLVDTYGKGRLKPPAGSLESRRYAYFMHYAEGSLMPPLLMTLVFGRLGHAPVPFFLRPIGRLLAGGVKKAYLGPEIAAHFDFLEAELSQRSWFAGDDFTAADIQMSFPLEAGAARAGLDRRPNLRRFLERVHERPAYQRALQAGGPFNVPG